MSEHISLLIVIFEMYILWFGVFRGMNKVRRELAIVRNPRHAVRDSAPKQTNELWKAEEREKNERERNGTA